jgi:hypothetical protein
VGTLLAATWSARTFAAKSYHAFTIWKNATENESRLPEGAEQRLNAAEALFAADLTLDAQYVGGYAVECSPKTLILEKTPLAERPAKLLRISSGATMHNRKHCSRH